jgi:hypothetical protein
MAMERGLRSREHNTPVEQRSDPLHRTLELIIPELEVTPVLVGPLPVEVEDQVEAPVETQLIVTVEVGVDVEEATVLDLVEPAADEVRV